MRDDETGEEIIIRDYKGPAGGWGSMKGMARVLPAEHPGPEMLDTLRRQNKPHGFMCVSCAWGKPAKPHAAEFCENGAKATAWEMSSARVTPDFFQRYTVTELEGWQDHDLEQAGRLTHPMRYDRATDKYVAASWDEAFAAIGAKLKSCDPKKVVLYASGRASLETSFMYALFARMWGQQNLPDSSNMCHETTSVGLKNAIGSPVATIQLEDYEKCDAIFCFGQNVGVNSPRMLHTLKDCRDRGVEIVTFNPLRERGWEAFADPQNPLQMAKVQKPTIISTQYHQVKAGGDIAALLGMCKLVLEADERARAEGGERVVDQHFIEQHTVRFEEFAAFCRKAEWDDIVRESGLTRDAIEAAARVYMRAKAVIVVYGMGITQHRYGMDSLYMLVNFLMLRGNIGREGAGPGPVRGHSNVQGQRTVGITEKTELAPVERLKALFQFDPPTEKGWDTVESCRQIIAGTCQGFVQLGGNFLRATPEHAKMQAAWRKLPITVHVATKLNKSHLYPGEESWILPCLGRSERDEQASGPQAVSMEDSFSHIYGSVGKGTPASDVLLSEPAIVAGVAKAVLPPNPNVPWDAWVGDYSLVRKAIEDCYPDKFANFNERLFEPGGFWKGNPASHRKWETESGKAEFNVPRALNAAGFADAEGRFRLITLRSNDQFNTTIYGYDDRFRGIRGTRMVVMMNRADMARLGVAAGDKVALESDAEDGEERVVEGLRVVEYNIPEGCLGGYYPELNYLIPLEHHALDSHVPAGKSVPVRVRA
ncbi:oxidoreductase alpha (molybdopterin) subunit [Sphingomonas metalli]|uniref:Oxidoreductase alpha (Molybdopterin) subunit n=1 Tax=Sphingomonas metalli TaxID=1779358 RepID=A0A916T7Y7_9SPHN|nr:FdhF/YdeP family oxidoreductase [Sphingomonas metalli]GGB35080.1 oxidoreductase alpha (molybdopterin) subunit [Sphingomonas metalli]